MTEAGLEALRDHARTSVRFPPVKSDPLAKAEETFVLTEAGPQIVAGLLLSPARA